MSEHSLIAKLIAIKRLMEDAASTPGEKENARKLLIDLMKKHHLTEADLVSSDVAIVSFTFTDEYEKSILLQVCAFVKNERWDGVWTTYPHTRKKAKNKVWIDVTRLEHEEIKTLYEVYRKALKKELAVMVRAFIEANNIYPTRGNKDTHDLTQEELKELMRVLQLAKNLDRVEIPRKLPLLKAQ